MAIPKLQINPVNVGAGPDDGTGDKLRDAVEKLNSNDASLEEVLAFILADADPELTTFAQIAQIIYDFNAVVQALPLPADIQAQVTAAINAALAQLPTPESYTAQITAAIQAALDQLNANNLVKKNGDQLTGALDFAATVSVASAATTDLSNTASNNIEVTGTATVTSFGVRPAGAIRLVRFRDAGLTLTHDPVNLILPGAANIVTGAGDTAILRSHGSGGWRVFAYQRADGSAATDHLRDFYGSFWGTR